MQSRLEAFKKCDLKMGDVSDPEEDPEKEREEPVEETTEIRLLRSTLGAISRPKRVVLTYDGS